MISASLIGHTQSQGILEPRWFRARSACGPVGQDGFSSVEQVQFTMTLEAHQRPDRKSRRQCLFEQTFAPSQPAPVNYHPPKVCSNKHLYLNIQITEINETRTLTGCPHRLLQERPIVRNPTPSGCNQPLCRALHKGRYAQCSVMSSPVGARARSPWCRARACATRLSIVSSCSEVPKTIDPC